MDITRDAAGQLSPAQLADNLRVLAAIPNSFSPASASAMIQEAAARIQASGDALTAVSQAAGITEALHMAEVSLCYPSYLPHKTALTDLIRALRPVYSTGWLWTGSCPSCGH